MTIVRIAGIGLLTALSVGLGVQQAAAQTDLTGANGSIWNVTNNGGTSTGVAGSGVCDDITPFAFPGLTVFDAEITTGTPPVNQTDAYDNGHVLFVNDQVFVAPAALPAGAQATELSVGPVVLSGLNVTVRYRPSQVNSVLRTVVAFENPSAAPIHANVDWATNLGSDGATGVRDSSSGDVLFTTADRWVVTSDDPTTPSDPAITHILFGPGSPAETPTSASQTVFDCSGTEGILTRFEFDVPAGETNYLMFFNGMSPDNASAVANTALFNSNPPYNSEPLTGIDPEILPFILNWDFFGDCRSAEKNKLSITAKTGKFKWQWNKGDDTQKTDFGDPLTTTNYLFCLVDEGVSAECSEVVAGANWKEKNKGFDFKLKGADIDSIKLKEGVDDKAKVDVKGLTDLTLPLNADPGVQAVLSNDSGVCWSSEFSSPTKNDDKKFSAK